MPDQPPLGTESTRQAPQGTAVPTQAAPWGANVDQPPALPGGNETQQVLANNYLKSVFPILSQHVLFLLQEAQKVQKILTDLGTILYK